MGNLTENRPLGVRLSATTRPIQTADFNVQFLVAPWPTDFGKKLRLKKLNVSNPDGAAGKVRIWDEDLSSTTPPAAGSASGALYELGVAASPASGLSAAMEFVDETELPNLEFQAGIAVQVTRVNMIVSGECEQY